MAKSNQYTIVSELSQVKLIAGYFRDFCKQQKIPENSVNLLELALVEAVNNIIIHAYDEKPGFQIFAEFTWLNSEIHIELTDSGKPFTKIEPDNKTHNSIDSLPEGKWGIDLIESIVDSVTRTRTNGNNQLILHKKI